MKSRTTSAPLEPTRDDGPELGPELDTLLDPLTRAAAALCGVPVVFVLLAGRDPSRRYAAVGLDAPPPLAGFAFETHVPLGSADVEEGRLCIADPRPRTPTDDQRTALRLLAEVATRLLQTHREASLANERAAVAERRIATILRDMPGMLHSIDADGTLLAVSNAWLSELGLEREAVVGRPIVDFLTPASRRRALDTVIPALFATGRCDDVESKMVRSDGQVIDVLVSAFLERDAAGVALGSISVSQNITPRRRAESALREEQERMARILEGTDAGTWELNVQTGETHHNARWAEMAGYTLEELGKTTGATWRGLMHHDDLPAAIAGCVEHYEGRSSSYRMESRIRHKNGTWVWILDRGRVSARDANGNPLWMHGTRTDITARKHAEEALRASQEFLQRVGQIAGVGGWELDCRTGRITWSEAIRRLHEVDEHFVPTLANVLSFVAPSAREQFDRLVRDSIASCTGFDLELPVLTARGRIMWAHAAGTVECVDGQAIRLVGALQDVTRRKEMERDLAEHRELLQVTLESIDDAVITTDNASVIQWLNPAAERMTGWQRRDAVGRPLADVYVIVDERSRAAKADPVARCLAEATVVTTAEDIALIAKSGAETGIEDSASPIRRADGQVHGAVLVFHDVSEQRRLNREMSHRATHDPLTGLVNRSEFETRIARLLAQVQDDTPGHALLYIDLDHFKVVNDTCGHEAGDRLLRQVSTILGHCLRSHDTLARLGGDEFGVILEHCDVVNAQRVAQQMCDEMDAFRFVRDGRRFRVGTSIGLVPVDRRFTSLKALLQAADASCYAAKEGGRNRVHAWFDSDQMLKARAGDTQWLSRLERAFEEERFELFGQRIERVDGRSERLRLEVLLRLRDPDGELVLPHAFLPAAERFHLATRIDRWVVRRAFEHLARVADFDRLDLVSINLSGSSLADETFREDVICWLEAVPFDRRKLCFEIAESVAITHLTETRMFVAALHALDVRVALDDFGAGASSFGYLKSLPVAYLKIDGHFVANLLHDPLNHAAVRCFCDVARVIGVATIAEAVESDAVREALRALGVDLFQGFVIHRPEPLDRLLSGPGGDGTPTPVQAIATP